MKLIRILLLIITVINASVFSQAEDLDIFLSSQELALPYATEKKIFDIKKQNFEFLVLDFWASWCGPCQDSMPFFEEQSHLWEKSNVIFVGINEDSDRTDALEYLLKKPVAYPMLLDQDRALSKKLGVKSIPRTFVFDKNLHLVKSFRGYTSEKKKEIKAEFEKLFKQRSLK